MAESSSLQSVDERDILQVALEHPFEPAEGVAHSSTPSSPLPSIASVPVPESPTQHTPSEALQSQDPGSDTWQATYSAQLSEWRAQSASARTKAELTRAKWEAIRAREEAERLARKEPPESWDLGSHLPTSAASDIVTHSLAASVASMSSIEHVEVPTTSEESTNQVVQGHVKESGSPSQRWEHISPSPTSSFPSMSFPETSVPHSPAPPPALLATTSDPVHAETYPHSDPHQNPTNVLPSTLPSIMNNRIKIRTRLSLVLSSLAINLLLPFINGVMLGFGEIFAKDVVVGWFGWKRSGSTVTRLGLRR